METEKIFYFSLAPAFYAARCNETVILLDTHNDVYLSIVQDAAHYLSLICSSKFSKIDDHYQIAEKDSYVDSEKLTYWIDYFLQKGFIRSGKGQRSICTGPLKDGGLIDYQWDFKTSWYPLAQTGILDLFKAFFKLRKVHKFLKKGISPILEIIKNNKHTTTITPSPSEIKELIAAVDSASLIYHKKTYCLAWAATFVLLGLEKKWNVQLVIAIQTYPFYAHAWAELDGQIVHDDPRVSQMLSIILKEPYRG